MIKLIKIEVSDRVIFVENKYHLFIKKYYQLLIYVAAKSKHDFLETTKIRKFNMFFG